MCTWIDAMRGYLDSMCARVYVGVPEFIWTFCICPCGRALVGSNMAEISDAKRTPKIETQLRNGVSNN
jgi:hypothetical protein